MPAVVAFPKTNWATATGGAAGGTLHRVASVVAFVCLPLSISGASGSLVRPIAIA